MSKDLELLIQTYENKDILRDKILKPIINNIYNTKKLKLNPIILVGPPGTGKTKFVENLSKTLNIPIIKYTTGNGYNHNSFSLYEDFCVDKLDFMSSALYKTKNIGHKSCIYFIDEIDTLFTTGMKFEGTTPYILTVLLESLKNETYIHCGYMDLCISIEDILFVCASNSKLSDLKTAGIEKLIALESRLTHIYFKDMTLDFKKQIIIPYTKNQFSELDLEYSDKNNEFILKLVSSDKNPGCRILIANVDGYINSIISNMNMSILENTEFYDIWFNKNLENLALFIEH